MSATIRCSFVRRQYTALITSITSPLLIPLTIMTSTFSNTSSSPALVSLPSAVSPLHRLPAGILPHVCSYVSPLDLLITLAPTSKTTRDLLTAACFSHNLLELNVRNLPLLSSSTLSSFHTRVLPHCRLSINVNQCTYTRLMHALAPLDHFPSCASLTVYNSSGMCVTDTDLHTLLRHPTTLSCQQFDLNSFCRNTATEQSDGGAGREQLLDWAGIRLPRITRLTLRLLEGPVYSGGAAFLTAHTALLQLDVTTLLVSVDELTGMFQQPTVLPQLTRFTLHSHAPWQTNDVHNLVSLHNECSSCSFV